MPSLCQYEPRVLSIAAEASELIALFNAVFKESENTVLVGGAAEPEYVPATEREPARVIFREDFAASALHEISHWCIAGKARRQLPDFGYWYEPDGRSAEQQRVFETVEVKPQALEWVFSLASGRVFHLSADNLGNDGGVSEAFRHAVFAQCQHYFQHGLTGRAEQFYRALQQRFHTQDQIEVPTQPC